MEWERQTWPLPLSVFSVAARLQRLRLSGGSAACKILVKVAALL